ncbi:MAG: ABC transporter ATP-binding protein [Planctomycetota bacterium]
MSSDSDRPIVAELRAATRVYTMGSERVHALDRLDFQVRQGEYWSVMGSSGSGKSTLLNVMGCLDRPTEGSYLVGGKDTATLSDDELSELRSTRLGFIFQSYNLIPQLDVLENILVPLTYQDDPPDDGAERARMLAERMGLGDRMGHKPLELSGGQQQRVAIARSLVNDPDLILADEATGNLDSQTAEEILALFDELHREGKTLVFVTHEPDVAARSEHLLRMKDGRVDEIVRHHVRRSGVSVGQA